MEQPSPEAALRAASQAIHASVLPHPHFEAARSELREALSCSPMALLLGTARTGKTRLAETMVARAREPDDGMASSYAAVLVKAPAPHRGVFSWRTLWKRTLYELDEPLLDYKVSRHAMLAGLSQGCKPRYQRDTEDALFGSVCRAARDRGMRTLFIDEAAELVKSGSGRVLRDQLDVLRSLADHGDFQVVLIATSRLMRGLDASGELLGRTEEVFVRRYAARGSDRKRDLRSFARLVRSFMERVPESHRFEPTAAQLRLLHGGTLGCVGHLSKWFRRAMERCISLGDDRLDWGHFEQSALSAKKFAQLEDQVANDDEVLAEWSTPVLRSVVSASCATASPPSSPETDSTASSSSTAAGPKRGARKPGEPNPTRRKVA